MSANTLFLRLEGPMQAWGGQESKFVVRRTTNAPTKSGIIGLLCCACGWSREDSRAHLPELSALRMGVRIDAPGVRWWDYHTVGAQMQMRIAESASKSKPGALLTRREYLCDASFLVAVQGEPVLIESLATALNAPKWPYYLGRKCCPPSRPLMEHPPGSYSDLTDALTALPWRRRLRGDRPPESVECLLDWMATPQEPETPDDAEVWYDVPTSFEPPAHQPRFVLRQTFHVGNQGQVKVAEEYAQRIAKAPPRPRANYRNSEYRKARQARLDRDHHLCIFCKSHATTVQHITYRRAGGDESQDDLRALCRLCHDAVTMLEYGLGMDMDRINPEEPRWRDRIIEKRAEIIRFRSLETRRRRLSAEEVE